MRSLVNNKLVPTKANKTRDRIKLVASGQMLTASERQAADAHST